jgi:hypothetical protein
LRSLGLATLLLLGVAGCAAPGPYRRGEAAIERFRADATFCPGLTKWSPNPIPIAYLEVDEQGALQDRPQVERALSLVRGGTNSKYVVVFVHGWFHNAKNDDANVREFKCALNGLQTIDDNAQEDVVGIYVGWRGRSLLVPLVEYATFWDRKNTSDEVGRGSLVEFLMRLEGAVKPTPDSRNKLMVVGHSFGASAVFNAIGQILLARFILDAERLAAAGSTPVHAQSRPGLVSGYGDLVVLINPAIEATRIVPFFAALNEYTRHQVDLLSPAQPPRLVVLSSTGDWATRLTFPAARAVSTLLESYQDSRMPTPYGPDIEIRERHLDWQTMGNATILQTHEPLERTAPGSWNGTCLPARPEWAEQAIDARKVEQRRLGQPDTGAGWSTVFDGTGITLRHRGITTPSNPLWILAVDTALISGHSDITRPVVMCFFNELLGDPKAIESKGLEQDKNLQDKRLRRGR